MCIVGNRYSNSIVIGRGIAEIGSRYIGNRDRRDYTSEIVVYSR